MNTAHWEQHVILQQESTNKDVQLDFVCHTAMRNAAWAHIVSTTQAAAENV